MANVTISGIQKKLPIIRLDGKDYFIMGGSYSKLHNETIITEKYTVNGEADRQKQDTNWHRWRFTLMVPWSTTYLDVSLMPGESFTWGDVPSLYTTMAKVYPHDGLEFFDITRLENFGGTYTHYVYAKLDWGTPHGNDPGIWQMPVELWGRDADGAP